MSRCITLNETDSEVIARKAILKPGLLRCLRGGLCSLPFAMVTFLLLNTWEASRPWIALGCPVALTLAFCFMIYAISITPKRIKFCPFYIKVSGYNSSRIFFWRLIKSWSVHLHSVDHDTLVINLKFYMAALTIYIYISNAHGKENVEKLLRDFSKTH